eukprot:SAG31_NODE_39970_length_284_cov_0.832432_1_plen_21_part_01
MEVPVPIERTGTAVLATKDYF